MLGRIYSYVAIGIAILAPLSIGLPVTPPAIAQADVLPKAVANSIKQDMVRRFRVPLSSFNVRYFSAQAWPDGCLGLAKTDEVCTQASVNGWRVEATDGSQSYGLPHR